MMGELWDHGAVIGTLCGGFKVHVGGMTLASCGSDQELRKFGEHALTI